MADTSIWREAFALFRRVGRTAWPLALGFAVIDSALQFSEVKSQLPLIQGLLNNPDPDALRTMATQAQAASSPMLKVAAFIFQLMGFYGFSVLCLQEEPITVKPKFDFMGFLYWVGQVIVKWIITILALVIPLVPGAITFFMVSTAQVPVLIIGGIIGMCAVGYVLVKFVLVEALAASPIKPAIDTSWKLSNGLFWRLVKEWSVFVCVIWAIGFVVLVVIGITLFYTGKPGSDLSSYGVGFAVLMGVGNTFLTLTGAAFPCAAARILYKERQQSDPTFTLTTPT